MEYMNELAYMVSAVAGVSVQTFRIEPTNTTDALAGRKVSFALPSSALLNMRTLALHFSADANQTSAAGGRLPPKITSLIDRIEIQAGGQMIQQGFNQQNTFHHIKDALCEVNSTDHVLGHPLLIRTTSYVDGFGSGGSAVLSTTANESYVTTNGAAQFAVNNFVGFPGTCEPAIQNMSLLPDCIFSVYFAGNEILGSAAGVALSGTGSSDIVDAGTATAAFKVYNLHLTVEAIGLASSVYDNVIASEIAAAGYVGVNFKNYFSFSDTHTGSTKFSVATQSLDRIWGCTRATAYDTSQLITVVKGHKIAGACVSTATGSYTGGFDIGKPQYDIGGNLFGNDELYTTAYFDFSEVATRGSASVAPTFQLQLNGAYIPTFKATVEELWQIAKNSVPKYHSGKSMYISLDQYRNDYFGFCFRLNLPSDDVRVASGLDTRSVALQGYLNSTGLASTTNMMIFAETTSQLRIGAGRQMNVVI
jgi:hypothetical protein